MESTLKIFPFLFLMYGVIGVDEDEVKTESVKTVSVMEGDSVTLNPDPTQIQGFNTILWRFGDNGTVIAQTDGIKLFYPKHTEIFEDKLQLNQTGSLSINNIRIKHTGLYQLQIYHNTGISSMTFSVTVSAVPEPRLSSGVKAGITFGVIVPVLLLVAAAFALIYYIRRISKLKNKMGEEEKSVMEGDSPILLTGLTEIQGNYTIEWCYEAENNLIAEINGGTRRTLPGADGRFRSKLKLNENNGDLTISNIKTIHSGLYKLKINSSRSIIKTKYKRFIVTVSVRKEPVMEGDSDTLKTNTEIKTGDLILWTFGPENRLVVKADSGTTSISESFRDRVQLDKTTGSLTIRNIRIADSGDFKLQIINSEQTTFRRFNVTVTGNRANESASESKPLLNSDAPDEVNLQQETSSV